jgi:hypothetical protein
MWVFASVGGEFWSGACVMFVTRSERLAGSIQTLLYDRDGHLRFDDDIGWYGDNLWFWQ